METLFDINNNTTLNSIKDISPYIKCKCNTYPFVQLYTSGLLQFKCSCSKEPNYIMASDYMNQLQMKIQQQQVQQCFKEIKCYHECGSNKQLSVMYCVDCNVNFCEKCSSHLHETSSHRVLRVNDLYDNDSNGNSKILEQMKEKIMKMKFIIKQIQIIKNKVIDDLKNKIMEIDTIYNIFISNISAQLQLLELFRKSCILNKTSFHLMYNIITNSNILYEYQFPQYDIINVIEYKQFIQHPKTFNLLIQPVNININQLIHKYIHDKPFRFTNISLTTHSNFPTNIKCASPITSLCCITDSRVCISTLKGNIYIYTINKHKQNHSHSHTNTNNNIIHISKAHEGLAIFNTTAFLNNLVISSGRDTCIKIWKISNTSYTLLMDIKHAHHNWIKSVVVLSNTNIFASCSYDNCVTLWEYIPDIDLNSVVSVCKRNCFNNIEASPETILQFKQQTNVIAVGTTNALQIINITDKQMIITFHGIKCSNRGCIEELHGNRIVIGDKVLNVVDTVQWKVVFVLDMEQYGNVFCIKRLDKVLMVGTSYGIILSVNEDDYKCKENKINERHNGIVRCIESIGKDAFISGGEDNEIKYWEWI